MEALRRQEKWHQVDPVMMSQKQFRELRPARNIITVALWVCLAAVSSLQLIGGVSPDSINDNFQHHVQTSLAAYIIAVCLLNIGSGWIPHSGFALGTEIFAVLLGTGGFLVYALVIADTNEKFWATASFAWAVGLLMGCALRAAQIFRRGY